MLATINKIKKIKKHMHRPNEPIHKPAEPIHRCPLLVGASILAEPPESSR